MNARKIYIYQHSEWPKFTWDNHVVAAKLKDIAQSRASLAKYVNSLGFIEKEQKLLDTLTSDILKSNEIEGEILNLEQVRSSIARHLGMDIAGLVPSGRHVDGVVEMMIDATQKADEALTKKRLFGWHAKLFPGPQSKYNILVGRWRDDSTGPMQVISGAMGKEKVHYQAPAAKALEKEVAKFMEWFNSHEQTDPLVKAAIAHLWFITLHPFEDGNGRMARAIADMQLCRADKEYKRFYSMSAQIRIERTAYYNILERTQKGNMDISAWLVWFLNCMNSAIGLTEAVIVRIIDKARFWERHSNTQINERQRLLINKLYDGFTGKLNTSKWARIAKCSHDTALRDIKDLIDKRILKQEASGGRSTSYVLKG